MFTQGQPGLPSVIDARRIARNYMVRNNPNWGNMSPMTLTACQQGDIIDHYLCWSIVCKAWQGYKFAMASYYVAF